jgi:glutamate-5-semialdehyde dehydrogenase
MNCVGRVEEMNVPVEQVGSVAEISMRARASSRILAKLPTETRNAILINTANCILEQAQEILAANALDCEKARLEVEEGRLASSLFDRLQTSERGVADMAAKVRAVASLPDPIGRTLAVSHLDNDLVLHKVTCPLGVIGVIFESRPDVVPQVGALCLKSGNAVLLKGGREAANTNKVLAGIWASVLTKVDEELSGAVSLLHTREDVAEMLKLDSLIDLIVPRGSKEFVSYIARHSSIPVLGHGEGICHVYVDVAADLDKAMKIVLDAKTNYPAACNAAETLLVHQGIASKFVGQAVKELQAAGVEVRGCARTRELAQSASVIEAKESDWRTEYSDLIISVKVVDDVGEAIAHIDRYGSQHTEAIVTENQETAAGFMESIDAAGVYLNASTRFADGFRYGFGAEVGISTSKLHARGPVGLDGLTTYKYKLYGNGHTVADFKVKQAPIE